MAFARTLAAGQQCRIRVYEIATGADIVVHTSDTILYEAPNWTAGNQLVLNGNGLLWSLPADGSGNPELIALEGVPELNNDHVLAPDGKPAGKPAGEPAGKQDGKPSGQTVFLSANDGHIYQASLRGGPGRRITHESGRMHFLHGVSPDGTTLAYVSIENEQWTSGTLRTIGVDGAEDTALTSGDGPDDGPEYDPAGDWIYFNTERFSSEPGHAQIARIRPDGTGLEQLTDDDHVNWFPHLSPDGGHAVYLSFPPGTTGHPADLPVRLRLISNDDWRNPATIAELDGGQGTINVNSWSPDGTRFAYVDYPTR
ncbi:TolB family protein [Actinoplanes sp. CA-015351]|uniref:TolB family protein n=1 Tax=Actinoplanes sp. CA-015351 TaxID=3239897 RepID=UPI003D980347